MEPTSRQHALWWSQDAMDARNDKDAKVILKTRKCYGDAIHDAFKSAEKAGSKGTSKDVYFPYETYSKFHYSRGLEMNLSPIVPRIIRKHRKKVMTIQKIIHEESAKKNARKKHGKSVKSKQKHHLDDKDAEIIRKQSSKYSRSSRLVACKIASYDQECIAGFCDLEARDAAMKKVPTRCASRNIARLRELKARDATMKIPTRQASLSDIGAVLSSPRHFKEQKTNPTIMAPESHISYSRWQSNDCQGLTRNPGNK